MCWKSSERRYVSLSQVSEGMARFFYARSFKYQVNVEENPKTFRSYEKIKFKMYSSELLCVPYKILAFFYLEPKYSLNWKVPVISIRLKKFHTKSVFFHLEIFYLILEYFVSSFE